MVRQKCSGIRRSYLGVGRFDGITKKHISKNPLTDNAATGFW